MGPSSQMLAAFVAALVASFGSCFADLRSSLEAATPRFVQPAPEQLSQVGPVVARLDLPAGFAPASLQVRLDGADVTTAFALDAGRARATLDVPAVGEHVLEASVSVGDALDVRTARVRFETVSLANADRCEVLNALECLLPYPSSRFLAPADTATGVRLELPEGLTPSFFNVDLGRNVPLDPAPYRALDGFSPAVQVLMHFPGGVDLAASQVSRLLEETRSYDASSLEPDHPTILLDVDTGERVLHFLETDARNVDPATGAPRPRQIVFLRPAEHLQAGHRYIVAVRRLVRPDGAPVEPEPAFEALRDNTATTIGGIESRRSWFSGISAELRRAGLSDADLRELVLAFDFVVASRENTTGEMLAMRDQAIAWLDAAEDPTFQVDAARSTENDCTVPGTSIWRVVRGTFQSPLFLTSDPALAPGTLGHLRLDAAGVPQALGFEDAPFAIGIPCAVLAPGAEPLRPVLIGHGLGQTGPGIIDLLVDALAEERTALDGIIGGTDWHGLSGPDFDRVQQLQGFLGSIFRDFDQFGALPDRLRQAQVNAVVLARMMRDGRFNGDPWFQRPDGSGVFPGRSEPMFYYGVSLGGIMGTFLGSLTPDIERMGIDVGASNFSLLLSRATPFRLLEELLFAVAQPDVTLQAMGISLIQELWTRGEPAGYAAYVTGDNQPVLPGSIPKKLLMTVARFDHQVSNQASEILARTLRLPSLVGSAEFGKPGIPDLPGPLPSALVYYDAGGLVPAVSDDYIPPLANLRVRIEQCDPHSDRLRIPASLDQLFAFFQPDGVIENRCEGLCDGKDSGGSFLPYEIPSGAEQPCTRP